jgi:hypothetical protein
LELIDMLGQRRLERELRRREAALRAAGKAEDVQEPRPLPAAGATAGLLLAQNASRMRGGWDCDFCGRSFHGYGSYLNHRCDGA